MPLLAFTFIMLSLALFTVEMIAYLGMMKWYYQLGPAMQRQSWQLPAPAGPVIEAIDRARPVRFLKLKSRRRGELFLLRFRWWDLSIWSRMTLHIEPTAHGASITYEIRPFVSPALLALSVMLLFGVSSFRLFSTGYLLLVIGMYVVGVWWEMRKLKSLEALRLQLADLGLSICSKCGYDRFGLDHDKPCPECGHQQAAPAQSAKVGVESVSQ